MQIHSTTEATETSPLSTRYLRIVLTAWIAVGIAASVRTWLRPEQHTVFPIFSSGAAHWWSGEPLYDDYAPLDYFRYPPLFAVLITPVTVMGGTIGGIVWVWLSMALYGAGLWAFRRDVLPGRWSPEQTAVFFLLALLGSLPCIWNAQSNALIIGLLLSGVSAVVRQRWWTAAAWLAMSVALKFTPLPLVLLFVALWPRQLAGRLSACLLGASLIPFLTRPPGMVWEQYGGWWSHLVGMADGMAGFRDGWTIWAVLRHLADGSSGLPDMKAPMDESWYRGLQILGGLAVLGLCLAMKARGVERRTLAALTFALGVGWLMLLGPAVEHPTYIFLAPALAWGVVQRHAEPRGRALIVAAAICILGLSWGGVTRPLWDMAPWLILALPIGTGLFLMWTTKLALSRFGSPTLALSALRPIPSQ